MRTAERSEAIRAIAQIVRACVALDGVLGEYDPHEPIPPSDPRVEAIRRHAMDIKRTIHKEHDR